MTRRDWLRYFGVAIPGALLAMPVGIAGGGLVLHALGVDVRWWWEA